jgi:hypothetical protein
VTFNDLDGKNVADPHGTEIFIEIGSSVFFLPERTHGLRGRERSYNDLA